MSPCYRCGQRQTDPGKGPSAWKRGVIADEQVLVCPDCQQTHDWIADLDRCSSCGSTMLLRALGETRCRQCSWSKQSSPEAKDGDVSLSDDVAAALAKRFGR
jgi:DNA-directed RNA polymerase subunit RPC12/RpoP